MKNAVLDLSKGRTQEIIATEDVTITELLNWRKGQRFDLILRQDETGGHAFVFPPSLCIGVTPDAVITDGGTATWLDCLVLDDGRVWLELHGSGRTW